MSLPNTSFVAVVVVVVVVVVVLLCLFLRLRPPVSEFEAFDSGSQNVVFSQSFSLSLL